MTLLFEEALAKKLADRVFLPLKDLVEHPNNQCSLYQIAARIRRVGWTP